MTSDKKNISLLADIFVKSGLSNIVISPGSRNAPIITSFANRKDVNALSIIDERSAAFFALGLALKTKKSRCNCLYIRERCFKLLFGYSRSILSKNTTFGFNSRQATAFNRCW
jgi:hypothetical protein